MCVFRVCVEAYDPDNENAERKIVFCVEDESGEEVMTEGVVGGSPVANNNCQGMVATVIVQGMPPNEEAVFTFDGNSQSFPLAEDTQGLCANYVSGEGGLIGGSS